MHRSLAPFSGPEPLGHTQSLADFITTTFGFRFSVHTAARCDPATFSDEAVTRAITFVARQPYLLQCLCSRIFYAFGLGAT
jgi:hypothetical protein